MAPDGSRILGGGDRLIQCLADVEHAADDACPIPSRRPADGSIWRSTSAGCGHRRWGDHPLCNCDCAETPPYGSYGNELYHTRYRMIRIGSMLVYVGP